MDMARCRIDQHRAAYLLAFRGEDPHALRLHAGPLDAADATEPEPPIGLDLLDYGAKRIHMRGQGNGRQIRLHLPFRDQSTLARARQLQLAELRKLMFHKRDGRFGKTGWRVDIQKLYEKVGEIFLMDRWQ